MIKKRTGLKGSGRNKVKQMVAFPARVLEPVRSFLIKEASRLARRQEELKKQDPFADVRRVIDSAAPDTDAAEQAGHERVSAFRQEADRRLIQVKKALARIKIGKYGLCEECGKMIDTDRLVVVPESTLCVKCEREKEK